MIKIENTQVVGWEPAIRGMRNPMNSWEKSDTYFDDPLDDAYTINGDFAPIDGGFEGCGGDYCIVGANDHDLMMKLAKGGSVHAKYRRMIVVYADITAPLFWWKEYDTYKVGTVANSCSTMHKIAEKEFTLEDFSCEHLYSDELEFFKEIVERLNGARQLYLDGKRKEDWWQMIQLLPSSYNQKRTVMLNYEVLANIYTSRKNHKLDEWRDFCKWIEELPYASEIIFLQEQKTPTLLRLSDEQDVVGISKDMTTLYLANGSSFRLQGGLVFKQESFEELFGKALPIIKEEDDVDNERSDLDDATNGNETVE